MTAAIYRRKSTKQLGCDGHPVGDDDKAVQRQEEHGRVFCASKAWTVAEVYADDGVSGGEVLKLRAKQRMLDDIRSGRAAFQVLVMQSNDLATTDCGAADDDARGEVLHVYGRGHGAAAAGGGRT